MVKILRTVIAAGLLFFALPVFSASERLYWLEDSHTRWDPSESGKLKSWVPAGAFVDILTCEETGWCFGLVYGHQEGWVHRSELASTPPPRQTEVSFLLPDTSQERGYHLLMRRNSYFLISNELHLGRGRYEHSDKGLLPNLKAWALSIGYGQALKYYTESRWDWELRAGHVSEKRYTDSDNSTNTSGFFLAAETKILKPDNEDFGVGAFAQLRWYLSDSEAPLFFGLGALITHGWGWTHPQWFAWKFFVGLNRREAYLGMGLDLHF